MVEKILLKLKIAESLQEDIDKGIARLPSAIMKQLEIVSGDLIEIKAKFGVALKAMRSIKSNLGKDVISIDGITRSSIGASIGEEVDVSVVLKINEAKRC